ncbi:hypothetical protein [Streptomyces sp. NPDC059979]|uniref:phage tail protein n=1 Tax=Streptomyces sp. NPDC059979 TaxID=3347021 RepID=UPI0036C7DDC7
MALTVGELVANISANDDGFQRGLNSAQLAMRGFQQDTEGRLRRLDGTFATMGERISMGFADAEEGGRRFGVSLSGLTGVLGSIGGAAVNVGKLAAMFGAAAPAAAGLAAGIAQIGPAAGVAATGLVAVQLATKTLKLGMQGVKEATSAALDPSDPEAYAKALEKLSPSARSFVGEIRTLQPQLKALQQGVQERMFQGLDGILREMGKTTLPVLKNGLLNTAGALNLMGKNIGNTAIGMSTSGVLGQAISGANTGLFNLSRIPSQLVLGFGQIAAAGAPAFGRLTAAAGKGADGISEAISKAFESGGITRAIDQALVVLRQLGAIAGNVFSIVGSIFSAAQANGGGFLGTLQQITASLATAFSSPAVQSGLQAIFQTMATLASTIGPLLGQALGALAPVFTALGPPVQRLIETLGAALGPIITALGPVLEAAAVAVGSLLDAVGPLIPVFASLIVGLLPALTPILTMIGNVFKMMAPLIAQVAGVLMSALAPILAALVPVLEPILAAFMTLTSAILPILSSLITSIAPVIAQLAGIFAQLMVALAPVIAQLILLVADILTKFTPILIPIIETVAKLASIFADELGKVIETVVIPAFEMITNLLSGNFSGAWDAAKRMVSGVIDSWIRIFKELPGKAGEALSGLGAAVWAKVSEAGGRMLSSIKEKVSEVVAKIRELPGMAKDALGNLGSLLYNSGATLVRGFIDGIKSMLGNVKDGAKVIVNAARNFFPFSPAKEGPFAGRGWTLFSGQALAQGFAEGISSRTDAVGRSVGQMLQAAQSVAGDAQLSTLSHHPMSLGSVSSMGTAGAPPPQRLIIEVTGPDEVKAFIRKMVQIDGRGSVQTAFG